MSALSRLAEVASALFLFYLVLFSFKVFFFSVRQHLLSAADGLNATV